MQWLLFSRTARLKDMISRITCGDPKVGIDNKTRPLLDAMAFIFPHSPVESIAFPGCAGK
ncbi:MAG: hypothetical protein EA392_07790 [Cryomorphaceae bacterium]|nr:MAG: hypothetical protein EA392_07790 [Cryomorphaceae bacterium]